MEYAREFVSNLDIDSTGGAVFPVLYLAHINVSNHRTFGKNEIKLHLIDRVCEHSAHVPFSDLSLVNTVECSLRHFVKLTPCTHPGITTSRSVPGVEC